MHGFWYGSSLPRLQLPPCSVSSPSPPCAGAVLRRRRPLWCCLSTLRSPDTVSKTAAWHATKPLVGHGSRPRVGAPLAASPTLIVSPLQWLAHRMAGPPIGATSLAAHCASSSFLSLFCFCISVVALARDECSGMICSLRGDSLAPVCAALARVVTTALAWLEHISPPRCHWSVL